MFTQTTLSELSTLEATMQKDHSHLLSSLARTLHSTAKQLEAKVEEIEHQNSCATLRAQVEAKRRFRVPPGKITDTEETELEASRVIIGAMEAANALKQESIIKQAVASILQCTGGISTKSNDTRQQISGDPLY